MSGAGPSHYFAAMRNFGRDHGIADDYPDFATGSARSRRSLCNTAWRTFSHSSVVETSFPSKGLAAGRVVKEGMIGI